MLRVKQGAERIVQESFIYLPLFFKCFDNSITESTEENTWSINFIFGSYVFCSPYFYIYFIFFTSICFVEFLFCLLTYFPLSSCFPLLLTVFFINITALFSKEAFFFAKLKARNKMFVLYLRFHLLKIQSCKFKKH